VQYLFVQNLKPRTFCCRKASSRDFGPGTYPLPCALSNRDPWFPKEALQRKLGVTTPAPEVTCTLPQATVFNILAYHVTEGRRFSNSVFNKRSTKMVEMLNGQYIVTNPNLTINDNAGKTIKPVTGLININASNGVIHVIDGVLEP